MHVLESYALSSGAKISKPDVLEKFFPSALNNYITLETDKRSQSKDYGYWQEVVNILVPILDKHEIKIAQVGEQQSQVLDKVYNSVGQTTYSQRAYLINRSMLHVGPDTISTDLASHFGKKIVGVFSNCLPSHFKPYWSKNEDVVLLEPHRKNTKPCYSFQENPKSIDSISPEKISRAVCDLLGIDFDYDYKYLFLGEQYSRKIVNVIPDAPVNAYSHFGGIPNCPISIRMDLLFSEEGLAKNLQLGPFSIVTNKPIRPDLISTFRQNIKEVVYVVEEENEPNFVKFLLNSAIKHTVISFLPEEILNPIKLEYMDLGVLQEEKKFKKTDIEDKLESGPLYYKSNKFILSNGKIFPSQPAWERGTQELPSFEGIPQLVIDHPTFWEDVNNHCILKKRD